MLEVVLATWKLWGTGLVLIALGVALVRLSERIGR